MTVAVAPRTHRVPWHRRIRQTLSVGGWDFHLTTGRAMLLGVAMLGGGAAIYRLLFGLGAATNLTDRWPWGLWVYWDVMLGVALAGGGYSTALMVNFLGKDKWKSIERAAFLTSLIGYLLVVGGLFLDLGRWMNVYRVPMIWAANPHSVMFELVWCVSGYTFVQIVEFLHIYVERVRMPRMEKVLHKIYAPVLIIGVCLPLLHQSALGSLYIIAKGRLDPLWWSMLLPLFFLMSSFFVGPAMVTVENFLAARPHHRRPPLLILRQMVRVSGWLMLAYFVMKVADLTFRGMWPRLFDGSTASNLYLIEVVVGIFIPMVMFLSRGVRHSSRLLVTAASLTVFGVALSRANVVFTGMAAQAHGASYFPSGGELAITAGLVAAGVLLYAFVCDNFPIQPEDEAGRPIVPETPAGADDVARSRPLVERTPWPRARTGDSRG
jgi:Ni/Fe-hydrogenase subunit HybB-like protein